jgi:uncharacterized membrane protein YfcA
MTALAVCVVAGAGVVAGVLGALLGLGGGVFLVPFLVAVSGLPFPLARGVSLMSVVATSSAVSASTRGQSLINLRIAMLLQVATAAGGLTGGLTSRLVSERMLTVLFSGVLGVIAAVMYWRLDQRNVVADADGDPGLLGGRTYDPDLGRDMVYRLRRAPVALLVSFLGGNVSSLLGIGGGVLIVPALNAWCGIPLRVAAATSAFMIGVTAIAALPLYWAHREVVPPLAAAAVLGVLAGSRLGVLLVARLRVRLLKLLMIAVLLAMAALMLARVP